MAKKKLDIFEGYGSDSTVVLEQKPFTMKDMEESFKKMSNQGYNPDPPILMPPKQFEDFRRLYDPEYAKKYYAKAAKFEALFHKGVVFEHQGSLVRWQVIKTFKHSSTKEVRCRIKSLSSGQTKELSRDMFNDFRLIEAPKAVTVLFGPKDE